MTNIRQSTFKQNVDWYSSHSQYVNALSADKLLNSSSILANHFITATPSAGHQQSSQRRKLTVCRRTLWPLTMATKCDFVLPWFYRPHVTAVTWLLNKVHPGWKAKLCRETQIPKYVRRRRPPPGCTDGSGFTPWMGPELRWVCLSPPSTREH